MPAITPPINFRKWIDEHRHLLKPPVGNQAVYKESDCIVMVIGGPNARNDFHVNQTEEFFYQLEGDMTLKVVQEGKIQDIPIREGEIFLLPGRVPHSPQRPADTIGLVVEMPRAEGMEDGFVWFCPKCMKKLYSEYFQLTDIVAQLPPVFDRFFSKEENCTCTDCNIRLIQGRPPEEFETL